MIGILKNWSLQQKWGRRLFCVSLVIIALIALAQTYWLMPRHFTQVDDIGVAESLMVRNMDYRDDCEKNVQDMRGKALLWVFKNPERVCKITTKLNRFSLVSSLWTYAPVQFWLTQAFLNPHKSYTYEEVKYWGRLPSFIFYILGVLSFYWLLQTQFKEFSTRPILVLCLTVLMGLSLEERIHAAQMHSYAIGIFSNILVMWAYLHLLDLEKKSYRSILWSALMFAFAVAMQYQALLVVTAGLGAIFVLGLCDRRSWGQALVSRYVFLLSTSLLGIYALVGNILEFSSRGTNWNGGPHGEFVVHGLSFFERLLSLIKLLVTQAPENFYAIASAIKLPNAYAYALGCLFCSLFLMGFIHLWRHRTESKKRSIFWFSVIYALIYLAVVFMGKLSFSPTRHFLFYLPGIVELMGYGIIELEQWIKISILRVGFLVYCLFSLVLFVPFSSERADKISDGMFGVLAQEVSSSFLIFGGDDVKPIFSEAHSKYPIFWYAPWGFDCAGKEILIPDNHKIRFMIYSKHENLTLSDPNLKKYVEEIISQCTSHTSPDKRILSIAALGDLVASPTSSSMELSNRVINTIHENSSYIRLYEITTSFDSHLYQSTLEEGIDFRKPFYPDFLKYVAGISQRENWGRWTDATLGGHVLLGFKNRLPKHLTLQVRAVPFPMNASLPTQIRIGNQVKTIYIDGKSDLYSLEFENNHGADLIEIIPPRSNSRNNIELIAGDPRQFGIGLVELRIKTNLNAQ